MQAGLPELVRLEASRLAWNQSPDQFWFHYTDRTAARAIVASLTYLVGDHHPKAPGLYVSDVQPGALSTRELLNALFDGTRDIERTQAAVVLTDGAINFHRVNRRAWWCPAPVGTELDLTTQLVGWAALEGGQWLYSPSLYV
jgi:hypothetical protein